MQWGRLRYISMFPWNNFLIGQIRELKNTRRKGRNQENSRKQEGNNGGKKEKRSVRTWRFPYWCVCHWLGMPLGYHPCATLRQPSVRRTHSYGNIPYMFTRLEKKHCSYYCPPHKFMQVIQVIIQAIVSSVRSNYRKQLSYYL